MNIIIPKEFISVQRFPFIIKERPEILNTPKMGGSQLDPGVGEIAGII